MEEEEYMMYDLNKKYTISSNSFILGGGDGYSMFAPYPGLKTSFGYDNEILLRYIQEYLGGEVPAEYNTTQNRIYISEGKDMTNPDVTPFTHSGDGFIFVDKLVLILVSLLFWFKIIFKFNFNSFIYSFYI